MLQLAMPSYNVAKVVRTVAVTAESFEQRSLYVVERFIVEMKAVNVAEPGKQARQYRRCRSVTVQRSCIDCESERAHMYQSLESMTFNQRFTVPAILQMSSDKLPRDCQKRSLRSPFQRRSEVFAFSSISLNRRLTLRISPPTTRHAKRA